MWQILKIKFVVFYSNMFLRRKIFAIRRIRNDIIDLYGLQMTISGLR